MSLNRMPEILNLIRRRYPALAKRLKEADAVSRWEAVVGPAIAKHSRAIKVQETVLWVEVDHSIWKSELHYRKRQILDMLNQQATTQMTDILFLDKRPG